MAIQNVFLHSFHSLNGMTINNIDDAKGYFFLKPEAISHLLNYEMFEHSKNESKQARREAKISIVIACAALILSLLSVL